MPGDPFLTEPNPGVKIGSLSFPLLSSECAQCLKEEIPSGKSPAQKNQRNPLQSRDSQVHRALRDVELSQGELSFWNCSILHTKQRICGWLHFPGEQQEGPAGPTVRQQRCSCHCCRVQQRKAAVAEGARGSCVPWGSQEHSPAATAPFTHPALPRSSTALDISHFQGGILVNESNLVFRTCLS